jgi:hypothetical protein
MIWFGVLGLLLPVALLLRWKIAGVGFGTLEFLLWPASIMLMGLEGNHSLAVILTTYALLLAANVVLYTFVALLTWPSFRLLLRRMQSRHRA